MIKAVNTHTLMRTLAPGDYLCPIDDESPEEGNRIAQVLPATYVLVSGQRVKRNTAYRSFRCWTPEIGKDERKAREELARTRTLKEQRRIAEDVLSQISRRLNWWRSEGGLDKTTRRLQEILDSMPTAESEAE